ncbi:MAG: GGDEF domain-containing protein [Nevskia sp.]|nr:GGDEF domain-containing protein [Nevskia sp.]
MEKKHARYVPSPETLAESERLLAKGYRGLTFPKSLERDYQHFIGSRRPKMSTYKGIVGIVMFNLFLICDYMLLPDMWHTALRLRLGVFTPVAVTLAVWMALKPPTLRVMKLYVAMACLLNASIIVWLFSGSQAPGAVVYQSGLLLVVIGMNTMLQLNFSYGLPASVAVLVFQACGLWRSPLMDNATGVYSMLVLLCTVVMSLIASYMLERDRRFAWLVESRERGRNQELVVANRELQALSNKDALTGIPNRRHFDESMAQVWATAKAGAKPVSLLMMDIDHFKSYNDHYGHLGGDECLRRVAGGIQSALRRASDLAARYGGEEFVVVLPDTAALDALHVAERIQQSVDALRLTHEKSPFFKRVTISIGVATLRPADADPDASEPADLVRAADAALYRAKSEGRHRICSAESAGDADVVAA